MDEARRVAWLLLRVQTSALTTNCFMHGLAITLELRYKGATMSFLNQLPDAAREVFPLILAVVFALAILVSALTAINGDKPPLFYRMLLPGPYRIVRMLEAENVRLKAALSENGASENALPSGAPSDSRPAGEQHAPRPREEIEMRLASPALAAKTLLIKSLERDNSELSIEEALRLYQVISDQHNRLEERGNLRETTAGQLSSTASTKTSMISLFVMFNLGIIAAFIFSPSAVSSAKELILGLYISLATFIVYVYRAANARALVLLAITEDLKRYHDAEKYMNHLRPKSQPTERDLEVLRLILTNRAEREKNNEHPYELVLKGVSNSNILLKGGKVMPTSNRKGAEPRKKQEDT